VDRVPPDFSNITPSSEIVLLCVREGWATKWDDLVKVFGYEPEESHTGHSVLQDALIRLERATLIWIGNKHDPVREWTFGVAGNLLDVLVALGVSLRALAANPRDQRMMISPDFGRSARNERRYDVFVLMPFSHDLMPIYRDHISKVLDAMSLTYARADEFFSARGVVQDIWNGIYNSGIVIADCTSKNPNVFYELGLAHAIGKPVILITQNKRDIPFDIEHIRYIAYEYTPPGMSNFEKTLRATIQAVRSERSVEMVRQLYSGNRGQN